MKHEKYKKSLFILFIIIVTTLLTSSCGKNNANQAESPKETPKDLYTLKLNSVYPPTKYDWEPRALGEIKFAKRVEEATNRKVKIKIYYNSQLAPQAQAFDALNKGVCDILSTSSYYGGLVPESECIFLPFWSKGEKQALHILRETNVGKIFDDSYRNHGAHVLHFYPTGAYTIISKNPVKSTADVKGMKFRLAFANYRDWYSKMGITPINISAAEQYEALLRGTIDATIYPLYTIETYKFYESAKYVTLPPTIDPGYGYVMINAKLWDSMPADLRNTMEKVSLELEKEMIAASQKMNDMALESCPKLGVKIIKLNKTEYEKFKQSAQLTWDNFATRNSNCAKIIDILKEEIQKWETRPEIKRWNEKYLS